MFSKKKNIPEKQEVFEIIIYLKEKRTKSYHQTHPLNSGATCIKCFYPFYKWFYYRETPSYSFQHSDGLDIILRSQITGISLKKSIEDKNDNSK